MVAAVAAESQRDVIVRLHASTSSVLSALPQHSTRQEMRDALGAHTAQSQAAVLKLLAAQGIQGVRPLWIDNAIAVPNVTPALEALLAAHPDVATVKADSKVYLPRLQKSEPTALGEPLVTPQKNIAALNTGALWDAGVSGKGVVVSSIDSGVRWTHEAVVGNYRGVKDASGVWNHDYAFWVSNTTQKQPLTPDNADIYGHGSHTMGTLAGSGPYAIGMAPNATWIHAKAFSALGASTESDILAAAQWVLCPTKFDHSQEDCSKGAHIVSMSWGGDHTIDWFRAPMDAMLKAGALPVFASGNVGAFDCGSALEPAWYPEAIAVGGLGRSPTSYYGQSGKGPGQDGKVIKPDFVAPAVAIKSILSAADSGHNGYFDLSGTSMATPHVAGALALLLSSSTKATSSNVLAALRNTTVQHFDKPTLAASSCGNTEWNVFPNNIFGWGLPDVCAGAASFGVACK